MTAEEFERIPSDEPVELVRGQLVKRDYQSFEQGRLQAEIGGRLYEFAAAHGLGQACGRVGIVLTRDPDTVLAPALAFLGTANARHERRNTGFLQRPPDLVVDIVSQRMTTLEINERVQLYQGAGVPLIWAVHAEEQRFSVWHSDYPMQVVGARGVLDGGDVLPGFRLPLSNLFE